MFSIKQKAAQAAKRAALLTTGIVLCAVGVGFCTIAAWLQLSVTFTLTQTALIIAACYLGVGLILVAIARSPTKDVKPSAAFEDTKKSDAPPIVQAFLYGMQAGANAKKTKPK